MAERRELVEDLRRHLGGQEVPKGTVAQCVQRLRINMQDEVSAAQALM